MSDFSIASLLATTNRTQSRSTGKGPARVVSIRRAVSGAPLGPTPSSPVTQQRLHAIDDLLAQELLVISTRRKLLMEIEADLAAGAEIEPGELLYHRELKMVRRKRLDSAVVRPISVQQ
jgi:hypothetical protein